MPMAISPLAIVLLADSRTHSYGISGAVTATYNAGTTDTYGWPTTNRHPDLD